MPESNYDLTHEEYEDNCSKWSRSRDVISGEDAIKAGGILYLPKLEGQNDEDYFEYKGRPKFFGATARTLNGLVGEIFRKEPSITIPSDNEGDEMMRLKKDADMRGTPLSDYARNVAEEILAMGRGGTLVDWNSEEKRAKLVYYDAEDIWNWREERIGEKMMLTMLALHEDIEIVNSGDGDIPGLSIQCIEQLLVLRLVPGATLGQVPKMTYTIETWQYLDKNTTSRSTARPTARPGISSPTSPKPQSDTKEKSWQLVDTKIGTRKGAALEFIPFVFHGPKSSGCCVQKIPIEDLIMVNLHHYRLSADYDHGLHYTGLPTPWIAGFDIKTNVRLGSKTAWVSDNYQAKAGFLEFTGQGLSALKDAIAQDVHDMAVLGARLIEEQKRVAEAADTMKLRQAGETSVLSTVSKSVSQSLTQAMRIAFWWSQFVGTVEEIPDGKVSIELNSDFLSSRLVPEEVKALTAAWISGGISHNTLLFNLRQGEMLPPGLTDDEEMALIEANMPPMPQPKSSQQGAAA